MKRLRILLTAGLLATLMGCSATQPPVVKDTWTAAGAQATASANRADMAASRAESAADRAEAAAKKVEDSATHVEAMFNKQLQK